MVHVAIARRLDRHLYFSFFFFLLSLSLTLSFASSFLFLSPAAAVTDAELDEVAAACCTATIESTRRPDVNDNWPISNLKIDSGLGYVLGG